MTSILFLTLLFDFTAPHPYSEQGLGEPPSFPQVNIINPERIWPNQTLVYSYATHFPVPTHRMFVHAMHHIMGRTCIRFRQKEDNDTDYIYVNHVYDHCGSKVGRIGGLQELWLPTSCASFRTALHELVHAIGFYHEHQRTDRDQYVTINWENIQLYKQDEFRWLNDSFVSPFDVPYDYKSIMHYTVDKYSRNENDTITPMDPNFINTTGVIPSLSDYDIKKINAMHCPGTQGIRIQNLMNGKYLTVTHREVKTSEWTNADNQKWTTHWQSLTTLDGFDGGYLKTWSPQSLEFEVLTVDTESHNVKVETHDPSKRNQMWNAMRKFYQQYSQWILILEYNFTGVVQCLTPEAGRDTLTLEICDFQNSRHLWRIYNV